MVNRRTEPAIITEARRILIEDDVLSPEDWRKLLGQVLGVRYMENEIQRIEFRKMEREWAREVQETARTSRAEAVWEEHERQAGY